MRSSVREPQAEFTKLLVHENQNMVFSSKLKETKACGPNPYFPRNARNFFHKRTTYKCPKNS